MTAKNQRTLETAARQAWKRYSDGQFERIDDWDKFRQEVRDKAASLHPDEIRTLRARFPSKK